MSANAENETFEIEFEDDAPESTPAEDKGNADVTTDSDAPVEPSTEDETKEEQASQDKTPANSEVPKIPKWRLDQVLEQNRALKAQLDQHRPQDQQPNQQHNAVEFNKSAEDFSTYEEYIEARAEFRAREAVRQEFINAQARQSQEAQKRSWQERLENADTQFSDKLAEAAEKNPKLMQKLMDAPTLRDDLQLLLKESKSPVALAEYMADNHAFVIKLNQMPMDKAIYTMAETEYKLTAAKGGPSKKPSSQAPDLDPVNGGNRTTKKSPYDPNASMEEFIYGKRGKK